MGLQVFVQTSLLLHLSVHLSQGKETTTLVCVSYLGVPRLSPAQIGKLPCQIVVKVYECVEALGRRRERVGARHLRFVLCQDLLE